MCGILGWLGDPDPERARRMRDRLAHRGPDDSGEWHDPEHGVWLGQRRLAILDLSPEGHQPMISPGGRFVVTFNGEIYNYRAMRATLEQQGCRFRGHSDTEVLVTAIEVWGLESAIERLAGMFAFGLYDRQERRLWLVRDRLGIKPLYYAYGPQGIAFASELQALQPLPWLDDRLDTDALHAYFRHLCIPGPATILRGARKLLPGELLRRDAAGVTLQRYWDIGYAARQGQANPLRMSFREAGDALDAMLREIVREHMLSDVPIGAFLSGGVDSSLVAALMQAESSRPVQTYAIGFSEPSHDESGFARAVAAHLGTDHREQIVTPADVVATVPQVALRQDEPFADNSSVPTYLLSRFTRSAVTVALSGDGGDELFGGYPRYFWAGRIQKWRRCLTPGGARLVAEAVGRVPSGCWDGPVSWLGGRRYGGSEGLSARVRRLGGYLVCEPADVYQEMITAWQDPKALLGTGPAQLLGPNPGRFPDHAWAEQMMAVDQENFLVDDVLTKVDRASMAVSLEARVPLLDHRFVEWSWRVPMEYKIAPRGDRGKLLLREVLYRYVPRELIERPKKGFGMPIGRWLRTDLRPWAEELLSPTRLADCGPIDPAPVRAAWQEHLAGGDRLQRIWTVLMFQQWLESWKQNRESV